MKAEFYIFWFSDSSKKRVIIVDNSMIIFLTAELQIRGGIEDSSKMFFLISQRKHVFTPNKNHLGETVLMMGLNKCFIEEIWKSIPNYPFYLFLSGALLFFTRASIFLLM